MSEEMKAKAAELNEEMLEEAAGGILMMDGAAGVTYKLCPKCHAVVGGIARYTCPSCDYTWDA